MRKFVIFVTSMLFMLAGGFAQNRITITENFDRQNSCTFTRIPQDAWVFDTAVSVSGKSVWGFVPTAEGDSLELISPLYDFRQYGYVILRFSHICKVSDSDEVTLEYKENYPGATWTPIPVTSYQGSSATYRRRAMFNQTSYAVWEGNNLLAEPQKHWWQTEVFDISMDVAFAEIQFRFKLKKSSSWGSNFAWGWLIDNFELMAATSEIRPPVVEIMPPFVQGTIYNMGPHTIYAKAAARTLVPLRTPSLRVNYLSSKGVNRYDTIPMTAVTGDSVWKAEIPLQVVGTQVMYTVYATDSVGNDASASSAYEIGRTWDFVQNCAALTAIDTPKVGAVAGQAMPVQVTIQNRGVNDLLSAKIDWFVNGVAQKPVFWTGRLEEGLSAQVLLGTYMPTADHMDTIVISISAPNGALSNPTSDSLLRKNVYGCAKLPYGTYVVSTAANATYKTIGEVLDIVRSCGSAGDITIALEKGTYKESVNLNDFMDYMAPGHTLTITSQTGKAEDVVLLSDTIIRPNIRMSRSARIVITQLTLQGSGSGILLEDANSDIEISHCRILLDTLTKTNSYYGIALLNSTANNIRINDNLIEGAYYGFFTKGVSLSDAAVDVEFTNNTVRSPYYGNKMDYTRFTKLNANTIVSRSASTAAFYGLQLTNCSANEVSRNRIDATKGVPASYGIYASNFNQDSARSGLFANNEILMNSTAVSYGIYVAASEARFYHNTVVMYGAGASRAMYCNNNTRGMSMHFFNNIFVCYNTGYPAYITANNFIGSDIKLDFNNYYGNSTVGYLAGNRATLAAWTQYSKEQNAVNINPSFQDYTVSGKCFIYNGLYCAQMPDVTTDILDSARSLQTVMGCYSANALGVDAAITEFVGWPSHLSSTNPTPVYVRLLNAGGNALTSVNIRWMVNGTEQTAYQWTGNMIPYADTVVNIGNYTPNGGNNNVMVWISGVNGMAADNSQEDDTLRNTVFACGAPLKGDFNVGGPKADFADLTEALYVLNTCGLGGHVTLRLAPGHYAAMKVTSTTIAGMSSTATVTFTTQNDTDEVILDGVVGSNYSTHWALCFDAGAAWFRFDNLILDAPSSYAGVCIIGTSANPVHDITISRCKIRLNPTGTGTQYGMYATNGNANGRTGFQIYSNHIDGGARGIEIYCGKGAGHRIDSNLLTNQYQYGINIQNLSLTSISYNTIICRSDFSNTQYFPFSVRVDSVNYACHNRIIANRYMFERCDGFYLSGNSVQRANDTAWIYNNEIQVRASCASTRSILYGMYIAGLQANIYHNSIHATVDSPSSTRNAYGLYAYYKDATRVVNIKNNLVSMLGGGNTNVYPLYLNVNDSRYKLDHNAFYSTSAGKQVAYIAGAKTNFSDVLALDSNAVWAYPEYVDTATNLQIMTRSQFVCPALVKVDIQGTTRKPTTTCRGAYDGVLLANNAALTGFASPAITSGVTGSQENATVIVENRGDSAITSLVLNWSFNGTNMPAVNWKGNIPPKGQEKITLGSFTWLKGLNTFEVISSQPNGASDQIPGDDTLRANMYGCSYASMNGTYLVGGKGAHFNTLSEAIDALRNCGIGGPVTIAIASGVYPAIEQTNLFPGSSAANTITFTSQSGNAADVIIGSSDPKAVVLNKVSYLTFDKLTIGNPVVTQVAVDLAGTNNELYFKHCIICADTTSTGGAYAVSVASGATSDGVYFIGNHLDGGYANFNTSAGNGGTGVVLDSNLLTNAYRYGISNSGSYMRRIAHNEIRCRKNATANYTAINWGSSSKFDTVACNRIRIENVSGEGVGMFVGTSVRSGACWVVNNEFLIRSTGTTRQMGFQYDVSNGAGPVGSWVNMLHNTFHVKGNGLCYALYYRNTTSGSSNSYVPAKPAQIKYNNFYVDGGNANSLLLYYDIAQFAASPYSYTDYNNYYTTGQNFANIGGSIAASLSDLGQLTMQDAHSVVEEPIFVDYPNSLHTDGKRLLVATDTLIAKTDLTGMARPKVGFTNIGCYHDYRPNRYDVKMEAIVSPTLYVTVGKAANVEVVITNMGTDLLDSVEIHWNTTGTVMPVYKYRGALAYGEKSNPISIGSFMPVGGTNTITVWVENPNGSTDGNRENDTLSIQIIGCDSALSGTYRVGKSAQAKYADLQTAVNALSYCGISGPVVFEIESGIYDKIVMDGEIKGSSEKNTVTFVSLARDRSTVLIGGTAAVGMTLNTTSNLRFEHLTIGSVTDGDNGVVFNGRQTNILFYHCSLCATEGPSKGAVVQYANKEDKSSFMINVRFIGNEIRGGAAGIALATSAGSPENCMADAKERSSVVIDSNTFVNNAYTAMEAVLYNHIASFSHNLITTRQTADNFNALVFAEANLVDSIVGNMIRLQATSSNYGILFQGYTNTDMFGKQVSPVFMANNEISCIGGYAVGVIMSMSNVDMVHNSIYTSGQKASYDVMFEKYDKGYQISMLNNVFVCENGSENYALNFPDPDVPTAISLNMDYNDYYCSTSQNVIFCGKSAMTVSQWAKDYSQDKNSVNRDPQFTDPTVDLNIRQFTEAMKCQRNTRVPFDIKGEARTRLTVMGAYSTPLYEGNDLAVDAFVEPVLVEIPCVPNATPVKVCIYNQGINVIDFSKTPMRLYLKCESDSVNIQTSITVSSDTIGVMGRDTFEVIPNLDITYLGLYKLTAWLECASNEQAYNDTLRLDYQVNKTILPYENNFSGSYTGVKLNQVYGTLGWEVTSDNPVLNPAFGTNSMLFRSSTDRGSISQVLFSSVRLQGTYRPQLYFWYAHDNANPFMRDQMDVRISQDGGATFKTIHTVYRYDAQCKQPTWKRHQVDLSKYNTGSCIVLAFTAYSYGGGDQSLDQIRIVAMQDMQLTVDVPSDTEFFACNMSGHYLTAYLENLTTQEVPFSEGDSITVLMSGASNMVYKKALRGRLEDLETDTLKLGPIDYTGGGRFDVMVYVNSIDSNTLNDTVKYTLNLNPDLAVISVDPIPHSETGDTVYVGMTLKNTGNLDIVSPFTVSVKVNEEEEVSEQFTQALKVGDTIHYRFRKHILIPSVTTDQPYYLLDVCAKLSCDANGNNDSIRVIGNMNIVDNGIFSVTKPQQGQCAMGGELAQIEVRLFNNGNVDGADSLTLTAVIDSAGAVHQVITEKIAPMVYGESRTHTFVQKYRVPRLSVNRERAQYNVVVFLTAANGDIDLANDTARVESCVEGGVGVAEAEKAQWTMDQNIPNPAMQTTSIPYSLPESGAVTLYIMSMNGQVLHKESVQAEAGSNEWTVDVTALSAGIYYYSMEYKGQRIVRKMNVTR